MAAEVARKKDADVVKQKLKILEGLDPQVRERVERLWEMQAHHDELESKLFEKMTALEFKYQNLYQPLYSQRYETVNATESSEVAIPKFWLLAMKNNDLLSKEIYSTDEEALMLLKDIKWSRLLDEGNHPHSNKGFRLDFYFDTRNPYFTNSVLTKTYHLAYEPSDYSEPEPVIEKAVGTEIKWHEGKDLTDDCDSFFDFFCPPRSPENYEDYDEYGAYELQSRMEKDYDLGCIIRDMIVPRAVSWFTREAAVTGDDNDENEDGEDEETVKKSTEGKIEDEKKDEDEDEEKKDENKSKHEENDGKEEKEDGVEDEDKDKENKNENVNVNDDKEKKVDEDKENKNEDKNENEDEENDNKKEKMDEDEDEDQKKDDNKNKDYQKNDDIEETEEEEMGDNDEDGEDEKTTKKGSADSKPEGEDGVEQEGEPNFKNAIISLILSVLFLLSLIIIWFVCAIFV